MVLVLDTPGEPEFRGLRTRFARELGLTLDAFAMIRVEAPTDFGQRSLAEQLRVVRPLIKRYRAIAATWIDRPLPELVLVTMMVVDSGRIMVRTLAGGQRKGTEVELALAARELLGTVFMFEPDPPAAVREVVAATTAEAVAAPEPPAPAPRLVGARAEVGLTSGIDSTERYPTGVRLGMGVQISLPSGFDALGLLEVAGGRDELDSVGRVEHLGLFCHVASGYRFDFDWLSVTPRASMRLSYRHVEVAPHYALRHVEAGVSALLGASLEGAIRLSSGARVVFAPRIGWDPRPFTLKLRSTGQVAVRTPDFYWGMNVGWTTFW